MIKEIEHKLAAIHAQHTGGEEPIVETYYDLGLYESQAVGATARVDYCGECVFFEIKLLPRNASRLVDFLRELPDEEEEMVAIELTTDTDRLTELAGRALEKWGHYGQLGMLQEESAELILEFVATCARLITAINHRSRDRIGDAELAAEVADVDIMLAQAKIMLSDVYPAALASKLDRLEARLTPAVPETIPAPAPEAIRVEDPEEPASVEEIEPEALRELEAFLESDDDAASARAEPEPERPALAPIVKRVGLTQPEAMDAMRWGHVVTDKAGDRWRLVGEVLEFDGEDGWFPWSSKLTLSKKFEPYAIEVQP